jgi:outer membrane protein TolC
MPARRIDVAIALLLASAAAHAQPPAEVPSIGFAQAVRQAIERHPTVTVAVEEIRRAEALVQEARSSALPTISANLGYTRLDGDRTLSNGAPTVVAAANQEWGNLTMTLPLVNGRGWVQWWHARQAVDVARWSAVEARRQLAITVARTYLSLLAQRRVIEVAERAVAAARAHYDFAHQRFAGGYGTRIDEVRAGQEVASDEAQLHAAYAQLLRLREALGVLLAVDHPVDAAADAELPAPPSRDQALHDATVRRSDVRLFKERLQLAERVRRDNWADWTPSLSATFQPFFQNPRTPTVPEWGWQALLALSIPLYDGGLRYGLGRERSALENEARATLEGSLRQAESDVRTGAAELEQAELTLKAARDAARLADDGLKLTNLAYHAGAGTNIEVIDAERAARDAGTAVAVAEDAERQAQLDLLVASGAFPEL